jgi:hypothetical protein
MNEIGKWRKVAGLVLHVLIGGLMLFAGAGKAFGFAPPEVVEMLRKAGLGDQVRLIGVGEILTAALLLIPRTSSLGILLTSSFWGGAIVTHMALGESYVFVAVLLVLSWLGAFLRNPATLGSFAGSPARERRWAEEPVLS